MASTAPGVVHDVPIELRVFGDVIAARLRELNQLRVYVGEVPDKVATDADSRVSPYAVVWLNLPAPATDAEDLADTHLERDFSLQVTVAAGYLATCLDRADQVHAHLHRWAPSWTTPNGRTVSCAGLRVPSGYQPAVQLDHDATPPRHYVPLQYRTTATA